jgi:hypothetical protein
VHLAELLAAGLHAADQNRADQNRADQNRADQNGAGRHEADHDGLPLRADRPAPPGAADYARLAGIAAAGSGAAVAAFIARRRKRG